MLGPLGPTEIVAIGGLLVLLFGAKRLPELGRSLGQGLREFKRSLKESGDSEQAGEQQPAAAATPTPPPGDQG